MKAKIKEIYSNFKNNFDVTFKFSAVLLAITIFIYLVLFLILELIPYSSLWGFFLILIIIYFLVRYIAPYIYSYFACNAALYSVDEDKINLATFIQTRKIGKAPHLRNAQRLFRTLLFSILIYIVVETIIMLGIYVAAYSFEGSELNILFNQLALLLNSATINEDTINQIYNLLLEHETLIRNLNLISSFVSISFAFYYFLHNFMHSLINFHVVASNIRLPNNQAFFYINKRTLNDKKLNYNKHYYQIVWPYYLAIFLVFSGSYLLMFFFLPSISSLLCSLTAMVITIFIFTPFIPVILNFNITISKDYLFTFIKYTESILSDSLNSFYKDQQMSNQNADLVRKNMESYKAFLDKMIEDEEKKKDSNNSEKSTDDKTNNVEENKNQDNEQKK